MLRGLAEYAMSGRRQAATVAVLFGLIPLLNLLSGAIVALVTLRKGMQEGMLAMLWALLPASLHWLAGDTSPVLMLVGAWLLAVALRRTESWSKVLLLATGLGLLLQLSLALQPAYVAQVEDLFSQMLAEGQALPPAEVDGVPVSTPADMVALLFSFYGAYHFLVFAACLMIGRSWQAGLYNPGGFRQEFHSLRFDPRMMAVMLALVLGGVAGIAPLAGWLPVFCMVPLFAGLAVFHQVVAARQMGISMLIMGYVVLVVMSPVMVPVVVMLGFVDSVVDIRKRWAR
jgi:hypothetical protein